MAEVVLWLKNEALPIDFMISLDEGAVLDEEDGPGVNGFLVDFRVETTFSAVFMETCSAASSGSTETILKDSGGRESSDPACSSFSSLLQP